MTTRIAGFTLLGFLAVSTLLFAQSPLIPSDSGSDNTATAPSEVRRAEPPPANWSAEDLETRGDSLRAEKAYADSIDYYRAALGKRPNSASLNNKMGMAELMMLRFGRARKAFERALKVDPQYAEAMNNLGVTYYMQSNYKKAIRHYLKAVLVRSDNASFYSNLGTAYFARKNFEQASSAYARALELDPEVFERRSRTGVSAHMASPADRARYSYVIAKIYARVGDTDRCLLYLKKAVEQGFPEIANAYKDEEFASIRKDPRFTSVMTPPPPPASN
ncbi:MAG: tetratricopeptide repeat protein [Terriglobales bacterium]